MTSTYLRRAAALTAGTLAVGVIALSSPAVGDPDGNVPLDQAGQVATWTLRDDMPPVPATLTGKAITSLTAANTSFVALTSDGTVTAWGSPTDASTVRNVPAGLSNVVQISGSGLSVAALRSNGTVVAWGSSSSVNNVPSTVRNVVDISVVNNAAFALKSDGTVIAWGNQAGRFPPPPGLNDVVDIIASSGQFAAALKSDGTVVMWGSTFTSPQRLQVPEEIQGHVTRLLATSGNETAVVTDAGKLARWGSDLTPEIDTPPAGFEAETVVDFSFAGQNYVAATASGKTYAWGRSTDSWGELNNIPATLGGKRAVAVASTNDSHAVLYTAFTVARAPRIAGAAFTGSTLTVTPAVFSGAPDTVTTQWLADGQPIANATASTLTLDASVLGKRISVRQTAIKMGEDPLIATTTATAAVARPQAASMVRATAGTARYGSLAPRVSISITPSSAGGRVDLYSGSRRIASSTVRSGRAVLVAAPTSLTPGSHVVSVRYAGDATTKPSSASVRLNVTKATAKVAAKVKSKVIKAKKTSAKISVTVRATGVRATGKVAIYQGKKMVGTAKLKGNGTAVVKLKKFKKAGKTKLTIRYLGSSTVNKATKTIKVNVRR